jgi:hypothetical protein
LRKSHSARKGKGKEAKLSYIGNALTENRHGLVVEAELGLATGTIEREAAQTMIGSPFAWITPPCCAASRASDSSSLTMAAYQVARLASVTSRRASKMRLIGAPNGSSQIASSAANSILPRAIEANFSGPLGMKCHFGGLFLPHSPR